MAQSAQSAEGDLLNQLSLAPLHKEADAGLGWLGWARVRAILNSGNTNKKWGVFAVTRHTAAQHRETEPFNKYFSD